MDAVVRRGTVWDTTAGVVSVCNGLGTSRVVGYPPYYGRIVVPIIAVNILKKYIILLLAMLFRNIFT